MSIAYHNLHGFSEGLADLTAQVRASVVQVHAGGRGIGSGIIWRVEAPDASGTSDATIVTNAHVVRATSEKALTLQLADQRQLQGTLSAVDPAHDLAALRVHAGGLQPAQIGNSSALRVDLLYASLLTPVASRNLLLYQSLPTSVRYRHANWRRRKDDPCVGTAARRIIA